MEVDFEAKKQSDKGQTKSVKNSSEHSSHSHRSRSSSKRKSKNYDSRSRSRNKRRSRSKDNKKKQKDKYKSSKYRSRSRSSSRRKRSKSKERKKDKHRKYNEKHHRGRSREKNKQKEKPKKNLPLEIPMPSIPTEVLMPPLPGQQRRRRQRSRSPLDYYRRNQNNNDGQFWDSFSWVPRMNYTPNVSTSALANTKKMRRLMITNIPYEIGISEENLRDLITRFMTQNYLKDQMNNCPVVNLQINQTDHNVSVELSSVEETCRMCRMEKIQIFTGYNNGIIRLGDSMYGNNILTQAQTAGTAQAAAFAAINVLQNKKTNFTVDSGPNFQTSSTVIRITNAVTPYMASHMNEEQWQDYYEDLIDGFCQYGTIVHNWFVKHDESDICADAGNLFIEYEYKQNSEAAMAEMQGRIYDQRSIRLYYWPRDLYYKNYRKMITPPALPPPLKTTKAK